MVTRLGILGGTFDPVHIGHLAAASQVHHDLGLDRVLLVPANAQPLKPAPIASGSDRLAMCHAAIANDPRFETSDVDLVRGGATYSVDTLGDLRKAHPGAEFFFITGADSLATLPQWKNYEILVTLATFVGVQRPGHSLEQLDAPHVLVDVPALAVSSTNVRDRVRAGAPIRYLVPDAVAQYVEDHQLYLGGLHE
ncbi:nicotinate-nucleotide adenylyltransferase [Demequina sp.]|uniref:nicotinate-nucleotide adenylyltransferase n=1 Tax=Demequina sp. TaxID=2050685 RepID=UPI003D0B90A7